MTEAVTEAVTESTDMAPAPTERTIDRIWPVGEAADVRVVAVRDAQIHLARALVLAARLDRLDLGHHLGRHLLGSHGVGVVVVVGDAHRSRRP